MNVREATPADEPWLLETLDARGKHDPGFRVYHYVVVETEDGERVGLGRLAEREELVELRYVLGTGEKPRVARAHAARALVERALDAGYDVVRVTTDSPRTFETVGFREDDKFGSPPGETAMRWVPPSERAESEETSEADREDESSDEGAEADESSTSTGSEATGSGASGSGGTRSEPISTESGQRTSRTAEGAAAASGDDQAQATSEGRSYKYDATASSPGSEETASGTPSPSEDDSAEAAARRQGFDPDSVNTKYDTTGDGGSRTTKYDAGNESESTTATEDGEESESRTSKYDTDSDDRSKSTKYST